jgi:hypothetical protein
MTEQKSAPLFTTRFVQGRRTFFFDIKKSKNEKPFLKICSSSIKGQEKTRAYITVSDKEVQDFYQAVTDATSFLLGNKSQ